MESTEMAAFFSTFTFLAPLIATQDFPAFCATFVFAGSSPVSRGKGVYNKGSPSLQLFFAGSSKIISKTGVVSTGAVENKLSYSSIVLR